MSINVTITIADQYAAAKHAFDVAEKALEALKKQIKASGQELHVGVTCDLVLSLSEQRRVDTKLLQALLTEEQIEACKKPVLVETIRVRAKGL
jgi:hypothetical protein